MTTNCATEFSYANEEEAFVILEDVCGTLKAPTSSTKIYTVGPVDFEQNQEFLDDMQIRASASRLQPTKGRKNIGSWSATTYVKPSGTLGTAPEHDIFFRCLMGTKTVNPATSVAYTLANQLESFSMYLKKGHTVFAFRGVTIQSAEFDVRGEAIATIKWSGNYMEQLWAGTCTANGSCPAGTQKIQLPTGYAQLYVKDMRIKVGTDTNSAAGYQITNVNFGTDQITISPVLVTNQGSNPEIAPWLPTGTAEVGEPGHGKMGLVTIASIDAVITAARVAMNNNIKYYENEKNNLWTAERFGRPKFRAIDGSLDLYFLKRGPSYFYRAEYQVANALIIPVGNVAGYIMQISIPYAEYRTPKISGDEEFVQAVPFIARASTSLNDEMSVTFV